MTNSVICFKCGKSFNSYQPLKFTLLLSTPYIKCPYCEEKKYLHFKEDDK